MALYKSWMNVIVRQSRSYATFVRKAGFTWFRELERHPEVMGFLTKPSLSKAQWTKFKDTVQNHLNTDRVISLDAVIMQLCVSQGNLNLGKSYMKYVIENQGEMNAALVGKYFHLLYNSRNAITEDDKREMLSLYGDLRVKHPLLDSTTAETCILAISLTEKWRETEELLEILKISYNYATSPCYSAIAVAAFKDGDSEMGWKYFEELIRLSKKPSTEAYIAYVDYCLKNVEKADDVAEGMRKLFNFFAQHDILPDETFMEHLESTLKNFGWVGTFTTLSNTGICAHCQEKLAPLKLSKEDFSYLSKTVLDKVIVGSNIYNKTTPYELKRFLKFINNAKPYDVVIDGLNVGYRASRKRSTSVAGEQLAKLVRYFLDTNKVVVVLGRKHMLRWDEKWMNFIKKNSFLFLTENLSADDPYLLYATLTSGPETTFISGDLMRSHKFILEDEQLKRTFKHWQMTHQCTLSLKKDKMFIQPPLSYLPVAQSGDECWHVPYRRSQAPLTESYRPPQDWLCLQCSNSRC